MITLNSIEQAYCFFHQKWRVYAGKSSEVQKDDIEYAISSYADAMDPELFQLLSGGKEEFLHEHRTFREDIQHSEEMLEEMMEKAKSDNL